jgi:hypothetical protein
MKNHNLGPWNASSAESGLRFSLSTCKHREDPEMSRRIRVAKPAAAGGAQLQPAAAEGVQAPDTYFDKVVKYIPADIVGAWVAVAGLIGESAPSQSSVHWIAFAAMLALTALWTGRRTQEPGKRVALTQIVISTVAFAVWVFALGGPFAALDFYRPLYGSLVLILYTLVVGAVNPPEG